MRNPNTKKKSIHWRLNFNTISTLRSKTWRNSTSTRWKHSITKTPNWSRS